MTEEKEDEGVLVCYRVSVSPEHDTQKVSLILGGARYFQQWEGRVNAAGKAACESSPARRAGMAGGASASYVR